MTSNEPGATGSAAARLQRVVALQELARPREALEALSSILVDDPESSDALRLLSEILLDLDRNEEGLAAARRAMASEPERLENAMALTNALLATNRGREAVQVAHMAATDWPNSMSARYSLGRTYYLVGLFSTALECANQAVAMDPHNADAHNLAGICLSAIGQRVEAERAYSEALRLDPQHALVLNNLASQKMDQGRLGSASDYLRSGLARLPQDPLLQSNHGAIIANALRRLFFALVAAGAIVACPIAFEAPLWIRSLLGGGLLATYAALSWRLFRRLPGRKRGIRGPWRHVPARGQVFGLLAVGAVMLLAGMSFAPQQYAEAALAYAVLGAMALFAMTAVVGWVSKGISYFKEPM